MDGFLTPAGWAIPILGMISCEVTRGRSEPRPVVRARYVRES
jgi:hypothetical protein